MFQVTAFSLVHWLNKISKEDESGRHSKTLVLWQAVFHPALRALSAPASQASGISSRLTTPKLPTFAHR